MKTNVLILYGYGINCDNETEQGFKMVGAETEKVHVNELINGQKKLHDYQILALPGGFSFGDDIGAGKVLANKFRYNLREQLNDFIKEEKLIIGICNGFQAMVKLGILPGIGGNYEREEVTLTNNDSGRFEDRWVYLKINPQSNCIWTKGITNLYLPIRHGEGKFTFSDRKTEEILKKQNQIVAQYVDDKGELAGYPFCPNGSEDNIAAICDETGRIFGTMPHPEGYMFAENHPRWTREKNSLKRANKKIPTFGNGLQIFKNAIDYIKK